MTRVVNQLYGTVRMIFGEINNFFTIVERASAGWKKWKTKKIGSVPKRFIELFESHGVHRNQIPRFFNHNIELNDLVDDASLLKKLTEPVLDAVCSLFGVRREWLDGACDEPYARHEFYKYPENFDQFIDKLKHANPDVEINGYLIVPEDATRTDESALILEESVGTIGDTIIYRYHLCDDWFFSYWKSRAYLAACVAIAWKKGVFVKGWYAKKQEIFALSGKRNLLGPVINRLVPCGRRWYAEDLALLPERYLEEIDPEENMFGVISALSLWLKLDEEGWMDTGLRNLVRQTFEVELAKYDASQCI